MIADNFSFAFASIADAPRVAALIERAYRGSTAAKGWTNESDLLTGPRSSVTEVEALIRHPESRFVMALANGEVVGTALLQKQHEGAYFGMFAIDPELQSGGVGKMVIARCESDAVQLWNAAWLRLTVISLRHELIGWYERRGFQRTGEREPFPFDTATGALRTDFDLVVMQKRLG
jgi:ribosomal protein S18 acetylase RimI-like enzyme